MQASIRDRRIEQEWRLLVELSERNPDSVERPEKVEIGGGPAFQVTFHGVEAITDLDGGDARRASHVVVFQFPRFYPGTPIEAYLNEPAFHPNIDPKTGFVCLWTKSNIGDTVLEALRRLRLVLSWRTYNLDADHIMQPKAAEHAREGAIPELELADLKGLPERQPRGEPGRRVRLS